MHIGQVDSKNNSTIELDLSTHSFARAQKFQVRARKARAVTPLPFGILDFPETRQKHPIGWTEVVESDILKKC